MPKERAWRVAAMSGASVSRLSLLLVATLGTACASGGPRTSPNAPPVAVPTSTSYEAGFANQPSSVRDTVLSESRSRVWAVLPGVLEDLGVEASTRDERAFVIGNEGWRPTAIHGTRLSAFLRCGAGISGPNADSYDVTALLLVQLEAPSSTETLARIVLDASARPRTSSGAPLRCTSAGTLEGRIIRLIGDRLVRLGGSEGGAVGPFVVEGSPAIPASSLPRVGDVLRISCVGPAEEVRVGQGNFVGAAAGTLTLRLGPTRPGVAVPAASVRSIQIRERHSHVALGGVVVGVIGLVTGGYVGHSSYDPEALSHYGQGTVRTIGAVIGAISGALVGAIGGWFVADEEWIDVPPAWWERDAPNSAAQGSLPAPGGSAPCPFFVD